MKVATVFVLVLAVSGCTQYVRPGATAYDVQRDQMECNYEANRATAGIRNGMQAGYEKSGLERQCMELRGYTITFR